MWRLNSSNRQTGVDRLTETWRIVFAPVLLRQSAWANREFRLRPVSIAPRVNQVDTPRIPAAQKIDNK